MTAILEHTTESGGLAALRKRLALLDPDASVKVGIIEGKSSPDHEANGTPLAVVAAANHFGVPGRIPERQFMTIWLSHESPFSDLTGRTGGGVGKLIRLIDFDLREVLWGRMSVSTALERVGRVAADQMKFAIRDSNTWAAPNAPSTIARKGSNVPLVETERLHDGITYEVQR